MLGCVQDTVEVFFDAFREAKDARLSCHFFNETMERPVHALDGLMIPGKLFETDHEENHEVVALHLPRADMNWSAGFMLECSNPGPAYQTVGLVYGRFWTRVPITPISTTFAGTIGACTGPFYTHRPLLLPWLTYYRGLSVQHFYLYHADWTVDPELSRSSGIFTSAELSAAAAVQHTISPDVDWLIFKPSAVRYYAGMAQFPASLAFVHHACIS